MTPEEFQLAIAKLIEEGLRLPFGVFPGSFPGGLRHFATQAEWEFYLWNPPEYLVGQPGFESFGAADPEASAKPSWPELLDAAASAVPAVLRAALIEEVDVQARERIAINYVGAPDRTAALEYRADGLATAAQEAERLRLRGVALALKARLAGTFNLAELEAIDVTSDSVWAP